MARRPLHSALCSVARWSWSHMTQSTRVMPGRTGAKTLMAEHGRRARFRSVCPQGREGSNPSQGTLKEHWLSGYSSAPLRRRAR